MTDSPFQRSQRRRMQVKFFGLGMILRCCLELLNIAAMPHWQEIIGLSRNHANAKQQTFSLAVAPDDLTTSR